MLVDIIVLFLFCVVVCVFCEFVCFKMFFVIFEFQFSNKKIVMCFGNAGNMVFCGIRLRRF
jgi:hypothetical protein